MGNGRVRFGPGSASGHVLGLGFLICLLLASCGGSGAGSLPDGKPAPPSIGFDGLVLPPPSSLRSASYDPAELVCYGSGYVLTPGYPVQNTTIEGNACIFSPSWTTADPTADGLAYACYAFGLEGYDRVNRIAFSWQQAGDPGDLWIGMADFAQDSWAWYEVADGNTLETDFTEHISAETHTMLVLTLLTGATPWQLDRIQVGDLAALSGRVFQDDGETPLYDAEVVAAGPSTYTARVDYEGNWTIFGVPPGDFSVSAHLVGWDITPVARDVSVDTSDVAIEDFYGTPLPTYNAGGLVLESPGLDGLRGVEMEITHQSGPWGSVSAWTDFDGMWEIGLPDGDYNVEASLAGWTFTPTARSFTVDGANVVVDNFIGEELPGYVIDGYIYEADGTTPLVDVQVNVTHDEWELYFYASTDKGGYWSVSGAPNGPYTVAPFMLGWVFEPTECHATVADANLRIDPFLGTELGQFTVDGYVYREDGTTPVPDVSVLLSGDGGWFYATTNSAGRYVFTDVYAGNYGVSPQDARYEFTPIERELQLVEDTTMDPFLATQLPIYDVDGYIYQSDGTTPVEGVSVTVYAYIPPGTSFEATTDASGYWLTPGIPTGFYTVWPQKQGYSFEPPDQAIQVEDGDLRVDDFIGTAQPSYVMEGNVYELDGATPVSGALIVVEGWAYYFEAITDASGHWLIDEVFEDTYQVTPMLAPWVFMPPSREVQVKGTDVYVEPFLGEEQEAQTVDGYIYESESTTPVPDTKVMFYNGTTPYQCLTDESGHYAIPLPVGDWTVWPTSDCWDFDPVDQSITVSGAPLTLDPFYAIPGG